MQIISGLIVSVDAFFIGFSLGLQKGCRFFYLVLINVVLLALCLFGFFVASRIYERIFFDTDLVVGLSFITLGLWYIIYYFLRHKKSPQSLGGNSKTDTKTIVLIGIFMSLEAMIITMGITLIFTPAATIAIPIVVALAHFVYSALTFWLARTKHLKRISPALSHSLSGLALIVYGVMAIVL